MSSRDRYQDKDDTDRAWDAMHDEADREEASKTGVDPDAPPSSAVPQNDDPPVGPAKE